MAVQRYTVKTSTGDWAVIYVDTDGVLSTVGSYGSYGYYWSNPGKLFKEFLRGIGKTYLLGKLSGGETEYSGELTRAAILVQIEDLDEEAQLTERVLLDRYNGLHTEVDYHQWCGETFLADTQSVRVIPQQLEAFYDNIWPEFLGLLGACDDT